MPTSPTVAAQDAKNTDTPYIMKEQDKSAKNLIPTTKAFESKNFLRSHDARIVRILCEFQEPQMRLQGDGVKGTILFFGSARSMLRADYDKTMADLEKKSAELSAGAEKMAVDEKIQKFKKVEWMCEYADMTEELARQLTQWSMTDPTLAEVFAEQPDYLSGRKGNHSTQPLVVTTGGGPGIMEAANRGAASVQGAKTMGMGITLPFENGLNPYVTPSLAFEFHYFFTRKFWMMYSAKALIIGPGGFGTLDEMFELLTLRQTGKLHDMPIVLLGSKFWKTVINWQALADFGTISQNEVDRLCFADDVETALNHIKSCISSSAPAVSPGISGPQMSPQQTALKGAAVPPM